MHTLPQALIRIILSHATCDILQTIYLFSHASIQRLVLTTLLSRALCVKKYTNDAEGISVETYQPGTLTQYYGLCAVTNENRIVLFALPVIDLGTRDIIGAVYCDIEVSYANLLYRNTHDKLCVLGKVDDATFHVVTDYSAQQACSIQEKIAVLNDEEIIIGELLSYYPKFIRIYLQYPTPLPASQVAMMRFFLFDTLTYLALLDHSKVLHLYTLHPLTQVRTIANVTTIANYDDTFAYVWDNKEIVLWTKEGEQKPIIQPIVSFLNNTLIVSVNTGTRGPALITLDQYIARSLGKSYIELQFCDK